jgi:hypothetical protein
MRLGFFTYPWDLLEETPEAAVGAMAEQYDCNAIALNASYHHARLLRPRAAGAKTLQLPGAVAAFQPQADRYPGASLRPEPYAELVEARLLARAREACARLGLDLGLWAVALHNSTLGERNPHLCVHNCFGDRYTYSLCPSQGPVQDYAEGLIGDLCAQFQPDRIILEAVGYLGLRHGVHHELFFAPWDDALELLFSLCFCPACEGRAEAAGLDAGRLRRQVAAWAGRLLEQERGGLPATFGQGQLPSLLAEVPGLAELVGVRARSVTELVARLHSATGAHGVQLDLIPASFHRPVAQAWLEGAMLGELAAACNTLLVPAYFARADQVAADLQWADWLAPSAELAAGLNACEPNLGGAAALAAQARACRAAGCRGIYTYNYGLLTHERLDWVAQAHAEVGGR